MVSRGVFINMSGGRKFTTEKVMSRVDSKICPGGERVSRVDMWVCLGGVFTNRKSDVQGRFLDLSWGECVRRKGGGSRVDMWVCLGGLHQQKK